MTTTKGQATNLTKTMPHDHPTADLWPSDTEVQLLTTEQVARRLAVDPNTVRRWIKAGDLEAVKAGRGWRVHPTEYAAFVARNTRRSEPLTLAAGQ